jgi:hypothetical protein
MMGVMSVALDAAGLATDACLERMDRVAVLYAEITAASREPLRALAECDRHGDWAEEGYASCADWLAWRLGITRHTARVRALTRAATPESEAGPTLDVAVADILP